MLSIRFQFLARLTNEALLHCVDTFHRLACKMKMQDQNVKSQTKKYIITRVTADGNRWIQNLQVSLVHNKLLALYMAKIIICSKYQAVAYVIIHADK